MLVQVLPLRRLQRRSVLERMAQRSAVLPRSVQLLRRVDRPELRRLRLRRLQWWLRLRWRLRRRMRRPSGCAGAMTAAAYAAACAGVPATGRGQQSAATAARRHNRSPRCQPASRISSRRCGQRRGRRRIARQSTRQQRRASAADSVVSVGRGSPTRAIAYVVRLKTLTYARNNRLAFAVVCAANASSVVPRTSARQPAV